MMDSQKSAFELAGEARLLAYEAEAEFARHVVAAIARQYRRLVARFGAEAGVSGHIRPAR